MSVTWTQFKLRNEKSKNLSVVHPDFQVGINGDILSFHKTLTSIVSHLASEILLVNPHPLHIESFPPILGSHKMVFTIFPTENPNIWLFPTSILSFWRPAFIIPIPWQNSEQLFANISLNTKKATDAVATKWQLCTGARLRRCNSFSVMHQKQKPEEEKFENIARGTTDPGYWFQNLSNSFS